MHSTLKFVIMFNNSPDELLTYMGKFLAIYGKEKQEERGRETSRVGRKDLRETFDGKGVAKHEKQWQEGIK